MQIEVFDLETFRRCSGEASNGRKFDEITSAHGIVKSDCREKGGFERLFPFIRSAEGRQG